MGNPYEVDDGDEDGIDSLEGFFAALMLDDSGPSEAFVNAINDELVADNAAAHLIAAIRGKAFTDKQYASVAEQVRRYWNDKNTENRGIGPDGSVVTETTIDLLVSATMDTIVGWLPEHDERDVRDLLGQSEDAALDIVFGTRGA